MRDRILKNKIDVGIVEGKPTNADIRYSPFLNDELLVFTSAQNTTIPDSVSTEEFSAKGVDKGLIRISIGLEDPQDLIDDISQALAKL